MSDTRLTEERLRTYLDTNQLERERMCSALLPLLGDYRDVVSRRPKGGPDGGRDLQAVTAGGIEVWGAIGFKNQVSDSPADKIWAKKKFKDDISAAHEANSSLKAFVFFTNVDLTPGELQELREHAESLGISSVNIFYREDLRRVLDSTQGAPYRLKFLGIAMSQEEQVAFFDSFGRDLGRVLERQHQSLDEKIKAIDFRIASTMLLKDFRISIDLDKEYFPNEIEHFRVCAILNSPLRPEGLRRVMIAGRDLRQSGVDKATGRKLNLWSMRTIVGPIRGSKSYQAINPGVSQERLQTITLHASLVSIGSIDQLADLQDYHLTLLATQSLCSRLAKVTILANGWVVLDQQREDISFGNDRDFKWPEPLNPSEEKERLRPIAFGNTTRVRSCQGDLHIDFEKVTPLPGERPQSLRVPDH